MASFSITLLGSISRIFFPSTAPRPGLLPSSHSDPDMCTARIAAHTQCRLSSSASMHPRPTSVLEGYWGWHAPDSKIILRHKVSDEPPEHAGLKMTDSLVVLACQPPRTSPHKTAAQMQAPRNGQFDDADTTFASTPECSFDVSAISDTSTSLSDETDSDTSHTLPSPSAARPLGLGLSGIFNADGSEFDGLGVLSFGCRSPGQGRTASRGEDSGGLSRIFRKEAAWTWAADPQHRELTVIQEGEEDEETITHSCVRNEQLPKKNLKIQGGGHPRTPRDLSRVTTISSELKRNTPRVRSSSPAVFAPAPAPHKKSVSSSPMRVEVPGWRV
ncbi:hypothetical protein C8J57DRAFT_1483403 [Mycena rebaudengoi]|nr:hypothetical protein C8J57DRAFT_1483403 [Mycena rebaudengoi]